MSDGFDGFADSAAQTNIGFFDHAKECVVVDGLEAALVGIRALQESQLLEHQRTRHLVAGLLSCDSLDDACEDGDMPSIGSLCDDVGTTAWNECKSAMDRATGALAAFSLAAQRFCSIPTNDESVGDVEIECVAEVEARKVETLQHTADKLGVDSNRLLVTSAMRREIVGDAYARGGTELIDKLLKVLHADRANQVGGELSELELEMLRQVRAGAFAEADELRGLVAPKQGVKKMRKRRKGV